MLRNVFIRSLVLSCIVWCAACSGEVSEGADQSGTTIIDLVISDPDNAADELAVLIDFVSYQITCPDSGLAPYSDGTQLNGVFELDLSGNTPVWELVTDLPPALCTISMWVFYEDEVICNGVETLPLVEDGDTSTTNKVNITLECNLSVQGPAADLGVDGSFTFINGNYCPKLFWLGGYPDATAPGAPFVFNVDMSAFDPDYTCGLNCDPQTCDFTQNPPVCTSGPDPGLLVTLTAGGPGSLASTMATGNPLEFGTTYTCDPMFPGPTQICALATDGDNDCNQTRCVTIECPDLCENVDCTDFDQNGNPIECTWDRCDPLTGTCSNDEAPPGIACNGCNNTCEAGGSCTGPAFTAAETGSTLNFVGALQVVNTTLVNPYSGVSLPISGPYNYNTSSYLGDGPNDVLVGTNQGDFLLVQDPVGTQRICGVETILSQNGFDALVLADGFIVLDDMVIEGGNAPDVFWANAGDDTLRGNNGGDLLDGGPGNDIIEGGLGPDTITLWPGSGFDSIDGGIGDVDIVRIFGIQSQVLVSRAVNPSYEFDIFFLGVPMAQVRNTTFIVMDDASIDLTLCTGAATDVCNLCGNDALNGGEECDDGNSVDGDGCAADCTAEF